MFKQRKETLSLIEVTLDPKTNLFLKPVNTPKCVDQPGGCRTRTGTYTGPGLAGQGLGRTFWTNQGA